MQNFMRLDDLLARDITVQWFEGVALVQSVCTGLEAGTVGGGGFPAESDIVLSHDGSVGILARRADGDAVAAAGRVLARMLTDDVPVRLRLVLTEATAGTVYPAVADFSAALAYFERPDREAIVRSLYERASRAEVRHDSRADSAQAGTSEPQPAGQDSTPRKKRGPAVVVLTAVGITAFAVISWAALRSSEGGVGESVSKVIESAQEVVRASQEVVRASLNPAAPEATAAPVEAEGERKPAAPRRSRAVSTRAAVAPPSSLALLPPTMALDRSALSWMAPRPGALDNVFYSSVDVMAMSEEEMAALGNRIFSGSDADVVPPRSVYPKLPANPPSAVRFDEQTVLDMVIGTNGLVEGVRLRTPPRNVHEFMLLSAAKAWRFEPALHPEGYPVRFRHSVVISVQ